MKYIVALKNGSVGMVDSDMLKVGDRVTAKLHDENGMFIERTDKVAVIIDIED